VTRLTCTWSKMADRDDPSFVELFEDIELPIPKDVIAFASQVLDLLLAWVYKFHDFLCRSGER
jgi:hypothetical protein